MLLSMICLDDDYLDLIRVVGLCRITKSKLQNYKVNYQCWACVFLHVKKHTKVNDVAKTVESRGTG